MRGSIPKGELSKSVSNAKLQIDLQKNDGFEKGVTAFINDVKIGRIDLSYSNGAPKFFDFFEIEFDPKLLEGENTLKIVVDEMDAFVSSAKIRLYTESSSK